MSTKYYITSPIYYVNDKPHIGHAYTTIVCDVIAQIARLKGETVFFMTGTDEHGQKIERCASDAGISPAVFVDQVAAKFQELAKMIGSSHNTFLRTSSKVHIEKVLQVWQQLVDSGYIYLGKYSGWYSIRDEAFYDEKELTDGIAPSGSPVEWVEEDCYFFALSKLQEPLLEFYAQNHDFVLPDYRFNEVINFVKSGLQDLAVSRTGITWGIPIPGDEKHVIYVWLDALTSYLSALEDESFWPAKAHVVGKDILRFHAVYWPAFLMVLNKKLPQHIVSHGWWTNEGQKISKSLGNVIDPVALVEEFGSDFVRYFLMREITFGSDGNFVRSNLINRVNSELNNKIGNLCQRVLSFIFNKLGGKINFVCAAQMYQQELLGQAERLVSTFANTSNDFALSQLLSDIIALADSANKYVDTQAPWQLIKENGDKALLALLTILEVMRYIAICLQPFVPHAASKILDMLQIDPSQRLLEHLNKDFAIQKLELTCTPTPIFTRIDYAC
jgi:methionyl-tRNA synthetase